MRSLYAQNHAEIDAAQGLTPAVHLRHAALERDRRCLLAYVNARAACVRALRWQFGAILPAEVRSSLCEPELSFFSRYGRDLAAYMRSVGGVDLTADLQPPRSLYIQVRCLKDYGEIEMDEDGGQVVVLKKNTLHYLPRAMCEPLIRQGVLQHVLTRDA